MILLELLGKVGLISDPDIAYHSWLIKKRALPTVIFNFRILRKFLEKHSKKIVKVKLSDGTQLFFRDALVGEVCIVKEIYLDEVYERYYRPRHRDIIFDVGAHIGIFALKASRTIGSEGVVFAFEPDPENFRLLKKNLTLNSTSNVKAFNKAVGSKNAILQLWADPSSPSMSSLKQRTWSSMHPIDVASVTLDHIVKQHGLRKINFLKLDVEGYELEVLRGGEGSFLNICQNMAIEIHKYALEMHEYDQIMRLLKQHGFNTRSILLNKDVDMLYAWSE